MYVCFYLVSLITGSSFPGHGPLPFLLYKHPGEVVWFYPWPKSASDSSERICALLLLFSSLISHDLPLPIHSALDHCPRHSSLALWHYHRNMIQLYPSHLGRYIHISKGAPLSFQDTRMFKIFDAHQAQALEILLLLVWVSVCVWVWGNMVGVQRWFLNEIL